MLWEEPQDRDGRAKGEGFCHTQQGLPVLFSSLRETGLWHHSMGPDPKVLPFCCPLVFVEKVEIRTGTWASASSTFRSQLYHFLSDGP